jgi:hypothetical protein
MFLGISVVTVVMSLCLWLSLLSPFLSLGKDLLVLSFKKPSSLFHGFVSFCLLVCFLSLCFIYFCSDLYFLPPTIYGFSLSLFSSFLKCSNRLRSFFFLLNVGIDCYMLLLFPIGFVHRVSIFICLKK